MYCMLGFHISDCIYMNCMDMNCFDGSKREAGLSSTVRTLIAKEAAQLGRREAQEYRENC
jgi:hypothetical protein